MTERDAGSARPHLRIARPVTDLARTTDMYRAGLGLRVVGSFENHDGFDGIMLGNPGASYHFELTRNRRHLIEPSPTPEDLVVLYMPVEAEWAAACARMLAAGFKRVVSFNPYWETQGRTFEDPDGYRVVLQRAAWHNVERA
jgi:catechol 2,3-dioxygenase-like lactoylglutathione lyase family enzyme